MREANVIEKPNTAHTFLFFGEGWEGIYTGGPKSNKDPNLRKEQSKSKNTIR